MSSALPLEGVIGFEGAIKEGLVLLPDGETLVYPLGATIVVRNKSNSRMQEFLQGHSNKVSCLAVSSSGRYLASGQVTHMGFTADIIVWDIATRSLLHRMSLHKVRRPLHPHMERWCSFIVQERHPWRHFRDPCLTNASVAGNRSWFGYEGSEDVSV